MKRTIQSEFLKAFKHLIGLQREGNVLLPHWKGLSKGGHSRGLTAAALIGAGTIGAFLLLRRVSGASLLWLPQAGSVGSRKDNTVVSEWEQLTVPGLQNIGSNCFLNAILQALASSRSLSSFLAAYIQESVCTYNGTESRFPPMPLAEAVSTLLSELSILDGKPHTASPQRVMLALEHYARHFDLASQQDAAEALAYLASALQEERMDFFESCKAYIQSLVDTSNIGTNGSCNLFNMGEKGQLEKAAFYIWRQHLHWPMEGTMGSLLTCERCGFQFSTQFQFFQDVPLSPSVQVDGNIKEGCSVEDCLEQFTSPELVTNVKCRHCSHLSAARSLPLKAGVSKAVIEKIKDCSCDDDCSCEALITEQGGVWRDVYTNALKQLRIGRSPEVLCLQIQRAGLSRTGELIKLMGHVSFPKVLNLFPYTISAQSYSSTGMSSIRPRFEMRGGGGPSYSTLWQNEALGNWKVDCQINRVPSNVEESIFQDTNLSLCLGIDVLTSNSSFESFPKRLMEGMLADTQDITQNFDSESIVKAKEYRNPNLQKMWSTESSCTSHVGQSPNISKDGCAKSGISLSEQVTLGVVGPNSLDNEKITAFANYIPGGALPFFVSEQQVPGFISTLQPLATSFLQNQALAHMPFSADDQRGPSVLQELQKAKVSSKKSGRWSYELISVIEHHGGPRFGHYTVYRKVKIPSNNVKNKKAKRSSGLGDCRFSSGKQDGTIDDVMLQDSSVYCPNESPDSPECHYSEESPKSTTFKSSLVRHQAARKLNGKSGKFDLFTLDADSSTTPFKENCDNAHSGLSFNSQSTLPEENSSEISEGLVAEDNIEVWFRVSDSHVEKVREDLVLMAQATLLFYEHCEKKENLSVPLIS